jgi:hypothetical protein
MEVLLLGVSMFKRIIDFVKGRQLAPELVEKVIVLDAVVTSISNQDKTSHQLKNVPSKN